jgi:hypothetical protein
MISAGLLAFVTIIVLFFGLRWVGIEMDAVLGPKSRAVQTDIHRNSKEFVDGTIRELRKLQTEYLGANDAQKTALKARILHVADELDEKWLTGRNTDLEQFLKELRAR